MANTIPNQERVVDPFASYNSNVVNRITEIVTHNTEGMLTVNSIQVSQDSTSPNNTVVVQPGYAVKDDVLIKILDPHIVDFTDPDNWVTPPDILFPGGNCYVVLEYQYLKQRPAPQARIKILQPNQRPLINGNSVYLLLKVVETSTTSPHDIIAVYDYDPEVGFENNARKYIRYYAGGEVNLPIHIQIRDQGRIAYESERDKFFFGHESEWRELTAGGVSVDITTDTTGVSIGQLCYVDGIGTVQPAISTALGTSADLVVTGIGTAVSGLGRGIISGFYSGVPVETGAVIAVGDILYLSAVEAGTVTNVRPNTLYQIVGRALTSASSTTPVDMIFSPKLMLALSVFGQITSWSGPDATGYYHDLNVAALDGTSAFDCHWFDDSTNREVRPSEVEILGGGNTIRVYFPVNTLTINYMIQSANLGGTAGGGGGGGGTSDHALLLSLDFASSGHTGFAPSPHNNSHHSQVYITAAGVTYENLAINSDIGSGSTQVAQGNHTHEVGDPHNYNDVPSGSIILFEADTSIVGYTLLTDQDDMVVYITKGSGAGGEAGGTLKSGGSWTQPNHSHGISSQAGHTHTTAAHTLTYAEMPVHSHNFGVPANLYAVAELIGGPTPRTMAEFTAIGTPKPLSNAGGGASHSHGSTGSAGNHDHGGATNSAATANTWRPRGRNLTRQQKI